jgi:hypothetical protein
VERATAIHFLFLDLAALVVLGRAGSRESNSSDT